MHWQTNISIQTFLTHLFFSCADCGVGVRRVALLNVNMVGLELFRETVTARARINALE